MEETPDYADTRVEYRDFFSIPEVSGFLEKIKTVSGSDGFVDGQYDFRYNCNAFCRKVFAQDAVFDEDDTVIWFDSDCVIYKPIPPEFFHRILNGVPFAYMGRGGKKDRQSYTETGWLGFNTQHEKFNAFRSRYLPFFTSGEVFTQLKGWHDCIAFDHARQGIEGNNLSPWGQGMNSVIGSTVLAEYMHHKKGARKFK